MEKGGKDFEKLSLPSLVSQCRPARPFKGFRVYLIGLDCFGEL